MDDNSGADTGDRVMGKESGARPGAVPEGDNQGPE